MLGGSYKDMLIKRARKAKESQPPVVDQKPLDYLELQNRRNMTAWKRKFNEKGD